MFGQQSGEVAAAPAVEAAVQTCCGGSLRRWEWGVVYPRESSGTLKRLAKMSEAERAAPNSHFEQAKDPAVVPPSAIRVPGTAVATRGERFIYIYIYNMKATPLG